MTSAETPDPEREPRTIMQRVRLGILIGVPVGLVLGAAFALMLPTEHQTATAWAAHLLAGVVAAVGFGGFLGATAGPRNREH